MTTQFLAAAGSTEKFQIPPDVPPRPVCWTSADGAYQLEELTHPCHLLAEGRAMRHCIGRLYYDDPARYGLEAGEPAASPLLLYWVAIEQRQSRIFSFTGKNWPLATLHVSTVGRSFMLRELSAKYNHRINGLEPYYDALRAAIDQLGAVLGGHVVMAVSFARTAGVLRIVRRPSAGQAPTREHALQQLKLCCEDLDPASEQPSSALYRALLDHLRRDYAVRTLALFNADPRRFGSIRRDATRADLKRVEHWLRWLAWLAQAPAADIDRSRPLH